MWSRSQPLAAAAAARDAMLSCNHRSYPSSPPFRCGGQGAELLAQEMQRGEAQRPQQRHAGLGPGTSLVSASFAKTHTSADESTDLANARVLISTWAAYPNPTASSSRTPIGRRIRGLPRGQWRAPRVPVDSQRKGMLHAHARGQWLGECLWRIAGQSSLDILSPGHQHVWPKPPLDVR